MLVCSAIGINKKETFWGRKLNICKSLKIAKLENCESLKIAKLENCECKLRLEKRKLRGFLKKKEDLTRLSDGSVA